MHAEMLVLQFSREVVDQPIIYRLVKDFSLEFNLLKAARMSPSSRWLRDRLVSTRMVEMAPGPASKGMARGTSAVSR